MIFSRRSVQATILFSLAILAVALAGMFEKNETIYNEAENVETDSKLCGSSFQYNSMNLNLMNLLVLTDSFPSVHLN